MKIFFLIVFLTTSFLHPISTKKFIDKVCIDSISQIGNFQNDENFIPIFKTYLKIVLQDIDSTSKKALKTIKEKYNQEIFTTPSPYTAFNKFYINELPRLTIKSKLKKQNQRRYNINLINIPDYSINLHSDHPIKAKSHIARIYSTKTKSNSSKNNLSIILGGGRRYGISVFRKLLLEIISSLEKKYNLNVYLIECRLTDIKTSNLLKWWYINLLHSIKKNKPNEKILILGYSYQGQRIKI